MHRYPMCPLVLGFAIVLMPLAAACSPDTVTPLPVRTSAPAVSGLGSEVPAATATTTGTVRISGVPTTTAAAKPNRPAPPRPTRTRTTRPATAQPQDVTACRGAVRYDLDLQDNELALIKSMCFAAGGVLRLQGIGPGLVTVNPASLVSQSYAGGVVDVRFVRKGTVDVKIPQGDEVYTITVVIT